MMDLQEKTILITGAARGIGFAESEWCAEAGARVWMMDSGCSVQGEGEDSSVVVEAAEKIKKNAQQNATQTHVFAQSGDANDGHQLKLLIDKILNRHERLDAVVLNAGIRLERSLIRTSEDEIQHILQTNLLGPIALTQLTAKSMVDSGKGGTIVLTLGNNPFLGTARQSILSAASGAIVGFVRSVSQELRKHNIRVHAVLPTARTRQTESLPLFKKLQPDALSPHHVAKLVGFLLTEYAQSMSGITFGVAGPRIYTFKVVENAGIHIPDHAPITLEEIEKLLNS